MDEEGGGAEKQYKMFVTLLHCYTPPYKVKNVYRYKVTTKLVAGRSGGIICMYNRRTFFGVEARISLEDPIFLCRRNQQQPPPIISFSHAKPLPVTQGEERL
jgi:hypothetical protein